VASALTTATYVHMYAASDASVRPALEAQARGSMDWHIYIYI